MVTKVTKATLLAVVTGSVFCLGDPAPSRSAAQVWEFPR